MKTDSEMRSDFERWYKNENFSHSLSREEDGDDYYYPFAQNLWLAFQAGAEFMR